MRSNGRTQSRCVRSLRHVERTVDFPLQQQHCILYGQAFQSMASNLTPPAGLSRGHDERSVRSNIDDLFQLVLRQANIVEEH